ncbi:FecR family protein [Telluribacter sp.]|jgi:ferric-dicitrate binding protein FerR (iron transport regulator)|uniref:FecR family protein n=1 Tax=Telluribacter sp. TaxID=1978767 RepID=UPI002E12C9A3|nr:FecR domain-containing protein [Telluribacter sp.]
MSQLPDTLEDLLLHDDFCRWLKNPVLDTAGTWTTWLAQDPEQRGELLREARLVLRSLPPDEELSPTDVDTIWQGALARRSVQQMAGGTSLNRQVLWKQWYRLAAVLVLASGLGLTGWYVWNNRPAEYQTAYGEIQTLDLPDGTSVTLNGHSQLRYQTGWSGNREVWLSGEAFFKVSKKGEAGKSIPFTVHTDGVDVRVLGTQFNVRNRRDKVQVLLTEGKVELRETQKSNKTVVLQPNDLAEYLSTSTGLSRRRVKPDPYLSWMDKVLVFEQASLREVAQTFEDTYGLTIVLADESLAGLTFTGNLPADDEELVLNTFAKAFGLNLTRSGNQVIFKKQ